MGRPSKLTDAQWGEVLRCAAMGETVASLATRFKVDKGTVSRRVSQQVKNVKTLAGRIAEDERALDALPISQRIATRTLADQLKTVSENLARAAVAGSDTAARLAEMANRKLGEVGEDPGQLVHVAALTRVANDAAVPALKLVVGAKEQVNDEPTLEDLVTGRGA